MSHAVSGVGYELYHCTITYESSVLICLKMSVYTRVLALPDEYSYIIASGG